MNCIYRVRNVPKGQCVLIGLEKWTCVSRLEAEGTSFMVDKDGNVREFMFTALCDSEPWIEEACPYCDQTYRMNPETECFQREDGSLVNAKSARDGDVTTTVELCDCGAVLAVTVLDKFGGQLYTPCKAEL